MKRELTDQEIGKALGWTDMKSWGGRGRRGLRPGADRHESLPSFTTRLTDICRALDDAGIGWSIYTAHNSSLGRTYHARVGSPTDVFTQADTPAEAMCYALLAYVEQRRRKS